MFVRDSNKTKMVVRQTIPPTFNVDSKFVVRHPTRGASQMIVREHDNGRRHYVLEDVDGSLWMTIPSGQTTEFHPMKEV